MHRPLHGFAFPGPHGARRQPTEIRVRQEGPSHSPLFVASMSFQAVDLSCGGVGGEVVGQVLPVR